MSWLFADQTPGIEEGEKEERAGRMHSNLLVTSASLCTFACQENVMEQSRDLQKAELLPEV